MVAMIWEDIPGFEGRYQINRNGEVKSLPWKAYNKRKQAILLKHQQYPNGYFNVHLRQNGKCIRLMIHRLLAIVFIPNPENKPQVNHINGVKTDNRLENLEWCTVSENMQHAVRTGLVTSGEKNRLSYISNEVVSKIRSMHSKKEMTVEKIGEMFNISRAHTYRIVNYERRKLR